MSRSPSLSGAFTALITPFKQGGVDEDALRALVERQIQGGIDGLVACGTTGESATMSQEEQLAVIRTVVEVAGGRVPVIAGTGSNDTRKSVAMTKKVAELGGVDAALVVCPYYNKPNQPMLVRHFEEIADRGGLPVVLYNVPGRTVVSLAPETIAVLAAHQNIVGIKEATGNMAFDAAMFEAVQGQQGFALLSGDDFTTMPFVAMGGDGCISVVSNLLPGVMSRLVAGSKVGGDLAEAGRLNLKIQALARALFANPNPVPTKEVAAFLGWCEAEVRGPLALSDPAFVTSLQDLVTSKYPELLEQKR